jgi:hypothetical protein
MSVTRINGFQRITGKSESLREFLNSIIPMIQPSECCESCRLLQSQDDPKMAVQQKSGTQTAREIDGICALLLAPFSTLLLSYGPLRAPKVPSGSRTRTSALARR